MRARPSIFHSWRVGDGALYVDIPKANLVSMTLTDNRPTAKCWVSPGSFAVVFLTLISSPKKSIPGHRILLLLPFWLGASATFLFRLLIYIVYVYYLNRSKGSFQPGQALWGLQGISRYPMIGNITAEDVLRIPAFRGCIDYPKPKPLNSFPNGDLPQRDSYLSVSTADDGPYARSRPRNRVTTN